MAMAKSLLEEALDGWEFARNGVIAELENIPAESFGFSPAAGVRTVAELARHIVEASTVMAGELSRADGDFMRQAYPEFLKEYAGGLDLGQDKGLPDRAHAYQPRGRQREDTKSRRGAHTEADHAVQRRGRPRACRG